LTSVNAFPSITLPGTETVITKICAAVPNNKILATNIYNRFKTGLAGTGSDKVQLPETLAYLNDATNQANFVAGGNGCKQFFDGIKLPLINDFLKGGVSLTSIADKIKTILEQTSTNLKL